MTVGPVCTRQKKPKYIRTGNEKQGKDDSHAWFPLPWYGTRRGEYDTTPSFVKFCVEPSQIRDQRLCLVTYVNGDRKHERKPDLVFATIVYDSDVRHLRLCSWKRVNEIWKNVHRFVKLAIDVRYVGLKCTFRASCIPLKVWPSIQEDCRIPRLKMLTWMPVKDSCKMLSIARKLLRFSESRDYDNMLCRVTSKRGFGLLTSRSFIWRSYSRTLRDAFSTAASSLLGRLLTSRTRKDKMILSPRGNISRTIRVWQGLLVYASVWH